MYIGSYPIDTYSLAVHTLVRHYGLYPTNTTFGPSNLETCGHCVSRAVRERDETLPDLECTSIRLIWVEALASKPRTPPRLFCLFSSSVITTHLHLLTTPAMSEPAKTEAAPATKPEESTAAADFTKYKVSLEARGAA